MKSAIATGIAFVMAIALYAYGSISPTEPYGYSEPTIAAERSESCSDIYLRSAPPTVPAKQAEGAVTLCRMAYASHISPKTRTALWSAEELSPALIRAASQIERASTFEEETSLPPSYRAHLDDYRRSGWDRGHLAPSADMPTPEAQQESFFLGNIIPQSPGLNRGPWAELESDIRSLARRRDSVHVITGILLVNPKVTTLPGGRLIIPDQIWKAVASPGEGTVVFIANNDDDAPIHAISLNSFRRSTGIDPFPGATDAEAANMLSIR